MKRIFISRYLNADSIFKQELTKVGYDVTGLSLLEFELIPFETVPDADWIFFYSQKAVRFFFQQIDDLKISLKKNIQIAAFGEKTAQAVSAHDRECNFTGTGEAKTTTTLFLEKVKKGKVLFPRAENSKKSIQQLIGNQLVTTELVIYKNFPKKDFFIPKMDILVFTSPLNAQVYFQKYKFEKGQKVFSIGATTAKTLATLGIKNVEFPKKPSEKELVNLLLKKT